MAQEQLTFDPPQKREGKLVFKLTVPHRLQSWNDILSMEEWQRYDYKKRLADIFMSSLRATANDSSMMTTSVKSFLLTCADTLVRYQMMARERRRLRLLKKRLGLKSQSELTSKSTKKRKKRSRVPF